MNTLMTKVQTPLLMLSGALLVFIGTSIMVSPDTFYAANNIDVGANASLLNELKAPAGLLLAAGLFMLFTLIRRSTIDLALGLAALIYLSYAASRFVSMALDGIPASGLVMATALEAALGLTCLAVVLLKAHPEQ